MTDSITATELEALLKDKKKMTLLDVRRQSDYLATPGKISPALWQDPENTGAWAEQLPSDRLTVVYCVRGGSVSRSVADQLRGKGLEAVFLEGGLQAWVENGGSVE